MYEGRHRIGNTIKCCECFYYVDAADAGKNENFFGHTDGWCTNPKALRVGINGHVIKNPPKQKQVCGRLPGCAFWIDANNKMSRYDMTVFEKELYGDAEMEQRKGRV